MSLNTDRMIVVSNRLPIRVEHGPDGLRVKASSGGLVTALRPLLKRSAGVWVGWTGTDESAEVERAVERYSNASNFSLKPVFMNEDEQHRFYNGFSNEVLWPLFHDLQSRCNFDPTYWETHVQVNRRFAEKTMEQVQPGDLIWVHDYHLMSVGADLRRMGVQERTFYFHHIPFPGPDIFEKLPWRREVLSSLLDFDVLGFQTLRDRRNFISCVRHFLPKMEIKAQVDRMVVKGGGRSATVGAFPISIDFREFADAAAARQVEEAARKIREGQRDRRIVLGVDRLDYTKGIPERLSAFRLLLKSNPELRGKIVLIQVVVPSREDIPKYRELRSQIQRMVSEINGHFAEPDWTPVHYLHRSLDRSDLLAYYRAADIALITPLKDGMNLVAKEYCACRVENDGVVVLSEFAGAAFQFHDDALLVNPYHTSAVADAIRQAYDMPLFEQGRRMLRLRERIQREDIFHWRDSFEAFRDAGEAAASVLAPMGTNVQPMLKKVVNS